MQEHRVRLRSARTLRRGKPAAGFSLQIERVAPTWPLVGLVGTVVVDDRGGRGREGSMGFGRLAQRCT